MTHSKEKFANLLTRSLERIQIRTGKRIYEIEDDLAAAIDKGRDLLEKWRRTSHKQMPSLEQAETVARLLFEKEGLKDQEEFYEFLKTAGHPYPNQAWVKLIATVQGPEPTAHFIGRDTEIRSLMDALQPSEVVTLYGTGGVGKTSLVAETIRRLAPDGRPPSRFPDGIIYHDFYRQPSIEAVLEEIARIFNEGPNPSFRAAAARALRNRTALLILDGAEEADNLRVLDEIRSRCGVLIVTRQKLIYERKVILLNVLPHDQAMEVLHAWSTDSQTGSDFHVWSGNEDLNASTALAICELLGRLLRWTQLSRQKSDEK